MGNLVGQYHGSVLSEIAVLRLYLCVEAFIIEKKEIRGAWIEICRTKRTVEGGIALVI